MFIRADKLTQHIKADFAKFQNLPFSGVENISKQQPETDYNP